MKHFYSEFILPCGIRLPTPTLFIAPLPLPAIKFVQFFTCDAFAGNKCVATLCPINKMDQNNLVFLGIYINFGIKFI